MTFFIHAKIKTQFNSWESKVKLNIYTYYLPSKQNQAITKLIKPVSRLLYPVQYEKHSKNGFEMVLLHKFMQNNGK
jgi:hypothetical protein